MKRVMLQGAMIAAAVVSTGVLLSPAVLAGEPVFAVMSPLGETTVKMLEMAPRPDTLANKTVCMLSNSAFKVNITMPVIAKALQDRYPGVKVIPYTEMSSAYSGTDWDALPAEYRSKGCNAVIAGNGG